MSESIGKKFWDQSKQVNLPVSDQEKGVSPQPALELPFDPAAATNIKLADPRELKLPGAGLWQMIEKRRTLRHYSDQALTLDELSTLLWYTQGVKRVTSRPATFRTVPSAGARHPFETYLLVNRVDGLQPGLYRYAALEHTLILVDGGGDVNGRVTHGCDDQSQVAEFGGDVYVGSRGRAHDLALFRARLSLHSAGCGSRLPESVPGGRGAGLRDLRHRGLRR